MMILSTFDKGGLMTHPLSDMQALLQNPEKVVWIDIDDPHTKDIDSVGELLHFHPLAIEDTRNDYQRPKVEEYDDYLFIIANTLISSPDTYCHIEELDIFLGKNYVVTVHAGAMKCITHAKERMERHGGFKYESSEFVFYVILDTLVDGYFPVLDALDNQLETLEDDIVQRPEQRHLGEVLELKRMVNEIVRVTAYQEGMFAIITRHQSDLLFNHDILNYYLRDVHDHLIKANSMSNSLTINLTTLIELYMSSTSNRLNQVVNRLTIATIIIGVFTVISGFYGMNFAYMFPDINHPDSFPLIVGVMLAAASSVLIYFRYTKII
jgi:magnesium transporter